MDDLRIDAYYYSFNPTGVEAIDLILSAIACAGKAYHCTEAWGDETPLEEPLQMFLDEFIKWHGFR